MAIGGVVINFAAKTADAVRDVGKLDKALGGLKNGAKSSGSGVGKLAGAMSSSLPVIGAVVGGAVALGGALVAAGKAAVEDAKQSKQLAKTLGNIPGITQEMIDKNSEWIDSMELATLVSDTDLRAAISKLTLATGDLGEAQTLAALSADVAAGSGKNYSTVADAMAKAAAGNTAQLERMFPWLDANKDGTVTLAEATKGLGEAYKGAAAEAAKNDPWKRLQTIWGQLTEAVGQGLLPIIEEMGKWFANPKNRQKILDIVDAIAQLSKEAGEDAVKAIKDFIKWLKSPEGKKAMEDFAESAKAAASAIGGVVSAISKLIDWWNKIPEPLKWFVRRISGGLRLVLPSSAPSTAATSAATSAAGRAAPSPVTINISTSSPDETARVIKRYLEGGDLRMGRPRGRPLAVAW